MRLLRQAVAPPRVVRPQLLVCGVRDAARSDGISPANIRRGFFGPLCRVVPAVRRVSGWGNPAGKAIAGLVFP